MIDTTHYSEHERAVAVHEGGHTLMAYICKVPFLYVSIEEEENLEHGRLEVENYPDNTWDLASSETRHAVEHFILVGLAGYLAQCRDVRGTGKYNAMHSVDHSEAWQWCQRLGGRSDDLPQGLEALALYFGPRGCCTKHSEMAEQRFDSLGDTYDLAMQSLVTALIDHRRLSAQDVTVLLAEVGIKRPGALSIVV